MVLYALLFFYIAAKMGSAMAAGVVMIVVGLLAICEVQAQTK